MGILLTGQHTCIAALHQEAYMLPDTSYIDLSTCIHLSPLTSCNGDKIVASLSLVCCWIQRDTSRPWHKWIVITYVVCRRDTVYRLSGTSNLCPSTCIRRYMNPCPCPSLALHKLLVRDTCFRVTCRLSWFKLGIVCMPHEWARTHDARN